MGFEFETTIEPNQRGFVFVILPQKIAQEFPSKGMIPVCVNINSFDFEIDLQATKKEHKFFISKKMLQTANLENGDIVSISISLKG